MYNQSGDIMQAIYTYTEQIERYENLSTWFAAFAAGSVLVVMILLTALLMMGPKEERRRVLRSEILSGVLSVIPAVITLYLYTFAMNMRKVALYRGYLCFLERQWNEQTGTNVMQFNEKLMGEFFSVRSFPVNGLGPVVMGFFVVLALALSFGLSLHFLRCVPDSRGKKILKTVVCVMMAVCVLFSGLCVYYLSTNDAVVANAIAYCESGVR